MSVPSYPSSYDTQLQGDLQPPSTVRNAFYIYLASAAIAILGVIIVLSSGVWDEAVTAGLDRVDTNGMTAEQIVNTVKIVLVVVGVLYLALYLFFAFKMRAGRNWARIVLTVLSGLAIVNASSTGSATVQGVKYSVGAQVATSWIGVVLAIAAIVLMYLKPSNDFFRASKAQRAGR